MSTLIASITLELFTCWECGVQFAVSSEWAKAKFKDDESIKCPNGHDYHCFWPNEKKEKDLAEENERLRREIIQEKHNAEQAEGRARDGKPPIVDPDEVEAEDVPAEGNAERAEFPPLELACPKCSKTYRTRKVGWIERHLRVEHGLKDEQLKATVNEIREAAIKALAKK